MGVRREKWLSAKPLSNAVTIWFIGTAAVTTILYKSPIQYEIYGAWLPWITVGIFITIVSLSLSAPVPRPMREEYYPKGWPKLRYKALVRNGFSCRNCINPAQRVHHIVPLSKGGYNIMNNLVSLCKRCHAACHPHLSVANA